MLKESVEIIDTKIPILNKDAIHDCFSSFLKNSTSYKKRFLQKEFPRVLDGYSFMGQTDSANQYDFDLLNTFVFSDMNKVDLFPKVFIEFKEKYWSNIKNKIAQIEQNIIREFEIDGLLKYHQNNMSYMISCNHYPAIKEPREALRLSEHKDVSLFTTFPFGIPEGFKYTNTSGEKISYQNDKTIAIFPGYLLEKISQGKIKALQHGVDFNNAQKERFSYAFFSIPRPKSKGLFNGIEINTETYFEEYLGLF